MNYLKYIVLISWLLPNNLNAQFYNNGAIVKVNAGELLFSDGNITNAASGTITNEGTLQTTANVTNNATLSGNGIYNIGTDWNNTATFNAGTSTVQFNGAATNNIKSGGLAFSTLKINKTAGIVALADGLVINKLLQFSSSGGKINLSDKNLLFAQAADVMGHNATTFIVTNGTGTVTKQGLGATGFFFPVGSNDNTYNPLTINQLGTIEDISVRCQDRVLRNGTTGAIATTGVVDASWVLTETITGSNNVTLTPQWAATDELPNFNRASCRVSRYNGTVWSTDNLAAASGSGPYTRSLTLTTDLNGTYAVNSGTFLTNVAFAPTEGWLMGALYPNPLSISGGFVRLSLTSPIKTTAQLTLLDNLGRTIHASDKEIGQGQNDLSIDIPALAVGIYHVKINVDGQFIAQKLIVQ